MICDEHSPNGRATCWHCTDAEIGALAKERDEMRAERDEERAAVVRYRDRVAALETENTHLRETLAGLDEAAAMNQAENARLRAAIEAHRAALSGFPKEAQFGADVTLWAALGSDE